MSKNKKWMMVEHGKSGLFSIRKESKEGGKGPYDRSPVSIIYFLKNQDMLELIYIPGIHKLTAALSLLLSIPNVHCTFPF